MTQAGRISRQTFEQLVGHAQTLHDEALKCAEIDAHRAAMTLLGASFEAMLLATVLSLEVELRAAGHWNAKKDDPLWWDFGDLLAVARDARWFDRWESEDGTSLADAAGAVKWFRNLIHAGAYIREVPPGPPIVDERALFESAYGVLDAAYQVSAELFDEAFPDAPPPHPEQPLGS